MKALIRLALLKRIYPRKSSVSVRLGNYVISGPDYSVLSVLLKEKFVNNEYYFSSSHQAPVIVDGGSNIGISVLYFKCLYPDAVIHCFEPYSKAFDFLENNVRQNNLGNIHLNRAALSDAQRHVDLFIPESGGFINGTINSSPSGEIAENVQAIKLSEYIVGNSVVDLIKLDVEGSEVAIIRDLHASNSFESNSIKELIIEFHLSLMPDQNAHREFVELLKSHSYEVKSTIRNPDNAKSDLMLTAIGKGL